MSTATIVARILPHQHTDAVWTERDCLLGSGERGYNTTNGRWKTGPGHWNSLSYDETSGGGGESGPTNTDELPEGSTNQYFTNARADARADARITAANLVPKAATSTAGFAFVDDDDTLAANSATRLATQRAVRAYVIAKFAEFIGVAPAELDTWLELVAAIQNNYDALSGIAEVLANKLATTDAPELIRDTIAAALVEGENVTITPDDAGNTITITSTGSTPPLVYDEVDGWPDRPDVDYPVFWVGGDAPEDAPPALIANDVWIPSTGDNVDLGQIVESLQLLAGAANTIPYFSGLKTFGALVLKTIADAYSDTALLSEKAVREYVDKLKVVTYSATRDLAASDIGKVVEYDGTDPATFTLPAGVMADEDVMHFRTISTGALTIAGAGVVAKGNKLTLSGQWTEASLHCRAEGSYVLVGDLSA